MKIKVERSQLEAKLLIAVSVLGNNVQPPILNEALIKMSKDSMSITTSDNQVTMTVSLPYEIESGEMVDFVCDIKSILKPVQLQNNEFMFIEVINDGKDIAFSTPKTRKKYKIPITYDALDFPAIKTEKWSDPVIIDGKAFARMIKKTSVFVNPNDMRQGMSGISAKSSEGTLVIQSTDSTVGCKTMYTPEEGKVAIGDMSQIIIPRAIAKVSDNYKKSPQIKLSLDKEKRNLGISDGSSVTYVRLLDGVFPNTQPIYDGQQPEINIKVIREEMVLSIDRLSGFSDIDSKCILLDMKGEGILIKSINTDRRKEAEELLEVQSKSREMSFVSGLDHSKLRAAIASLSGEDIYLSQAAFKLPIFITDNSSEGFETIMLVAPINIGAKHNEQEVKEEEVQY